jgi:hypothetical protein
MAAIVISIHLVSGFLGILFILLLIFCFVVNDTLQESGFPAAKLLTTKPRYKHFPKTIENGKNNFQNEIAP